MTEFNEEDRRFTSKVKKFLPTDDERTLMLVTILGASVSLVKFLNSKSSVSDWPLDVKYAATLISSNILSFISDGKAPEIINVYIENSNYEMQEQTQEHIYRLMKEIVMRLYEHLKEDEKV